MLEIIFKPMMLANVVVCYILRDAKMGSKLSHERYQKLQFVLILP